MTPPRMTISIAPGPHCPNDSATVCAKPNENGSSKEKHFLRTNKTNLPRSEPAISVPWGTKIKSNSRRLRLICKKSHCQASVIPNIAHLIRDDPPPTWEETFVSGFEEAAIDQQGRPLIVF